MSSSNGVGNGDRGGGGGGGGGVNSKNFIEHHVSKMDTLAGVAIKYGVEVADLKRLNGLATDLQMFALKTLLIPLPGRHPPSPVVSSSSSSSQKNGLPPPANSGENGYEKAPRRPRHTNLLDSFETLRLKPREQKVSSAMSSLQNYYGLKTSNHKGATEGTEMSVYRAQSPNSLTETVSNSFLHENGAEAECVRLAEAGDGEGERSIDKSVRRRQKGEADSRGGTPERLLKEDGNGGTGDFSPLTGMGLSMRPKSASKSSLASESEQGWLNSMPVGLGDSIITDGLNRVRKSSSTPSLQDQESSNVSVWPTPMWSLKPDLPSLSTAAISIPIFDGLPKPISGRKGKAALD